MKIVKAAFQKGMISVSKTDAKWEQVPKKKHYTAPKLTVIGKINAADVDLNLSPELRLTLLGLEGALNREMQGI